MNKCKQCSNEVTGKQVYCSPKCKQVAYRNSRNAPAVTKEPLTVTDVTVTPTVTSPVEQLTRKQLKTAIDSCSEDTWKYSPEYKELIHRLHTRTVGELTDDGYYIPSWKYSGCGLALEAAGPAACVAAGGKV